MTANTAKYALPYLTPADQAAGIDDASQALATRLDLLLGESGTVNITPGAVNVETQVRVNYSRSYAALAPLVPVAIAVLNDDVPSTQTTHVRTLGLDATGFTLGIRSSVTTQRTIRWRAGV